jgi:penicillin-binding protein 1A
MWMDFMKVAVASKPDEQFSRANAPKKQLNVPVAPAGEDQPLAKPDAKDDDSDDDTDKPAPAPRSPVTDAVPNDTAAPAPSTAPKSAAAPQD